jgi:hypothetical protein
MRLHQPKERANHRFAGAVSGGKSFVTRQSFGNGAAIFLSDERQKTANDEPNPATLLSGKKACKEIGFGETVRLKVRNTDGTESAEFSYTRPAQ